MNVVICDDDSVFASELKACVEQIFSTLHISAALKVYTDSLVCKNAKEPADIAFLDIQMAPVSGIELAKQIKALNSGVIIFFITSYEQYLDDAMDLNAFRYIKKPLDAKRLEAGLKKALAHFDASVITFAVKNTRSAKTISVGDIVYIEITGRDTKVVTLEDAYLAELTIREWRNRLSMPTFQTVHKSFIVNIKYVTDYKRDTVTLLGKYQIPIAYRKQSDFRSFFFDYFGGL